MKTLVPAAYRILAVALFVSLLVPCVADAATFSVSTLTALKTALTNAYMWPWRVLRQQRLASTGCPT